MLCYLSMQAQNFYCKRGKTEWAFTSMRAATPLLRIYIKCCTTHWILNPESKHRNSPTMTMLGNWAQGFSHSISKFSSAPKKHPRSFTACKKVFRNNTGNLRKCLFNINAQATAPCNRMEGPQPSEEASQNLLKMFQLSNCHSEQVLPFVYYGKVFIPSSLALLTNTKRGMSLFNSDIYMVSILAWILRHPICAALNSLQFYLSRK